MSEAAIVVVSRGEPVDRLVRLFRACAKQTVRCPVYVAAPDVDRGNIHAAADGVGLDVRHVSNPDGSRSGGLNRAAAAATESVLCRLDARTQPPVDYVERCVVALRDPAVGVVGGVQRPVAGDRSIIARGIARALANPYAVGAPSYRVGARSGPVDTVYLGAFRREELLHLGGFDEALEANEDFELAVRYRRTGAMIWLDHQIVHDYEARVTLAEVIEQYRAFGRAKVLFWRRTGTWPNVRQSAAILLVGGGLTAVMGAGRRIAIASMGLAVVGVVDHVAEPHERNPAVRAVAVLVEVIVPVAWVLGIIAEAASLRLKGNLLPTLTTSRGR